jgi:hypothetical protein
LRFGTSPQRGIETRIAATAPPGTARQARAPDRAVGAEGPAQERGQRRLLAVGVAQCFAQEMNAEALPGAAEHLGDRLLEGSWASETISCMAEAALDQAAEEAAPEGLGLGLAQIERDHLAVGGLVHVGRARAPWARPGPSRGLLHLCIQPRVLGATLERLVAEGVDLLVEPQADPGDFTLRDP